MGNFWGFLSFFLPVLLRWVFRESFPHFWLGCKHVLSRSNLMCFPHSLRLWLGWLERPFRFWQCFAIYENDAQSFLSTSEGWPCGHWGLFSGATGVDEKSPLSAAARVLLARHASHSCSLASVVSHWLWWQKWWHTPYASHCNYWKYFASVIKIVHRFSLNQRNKS